MRLLIPLVAGALVVCASLGAANSGTEPIQGEEVKLTVRTMSLDTYRVYAQWDEKGREIRLGEVRSRRPRTFTFDWRPGELRIGLLNITTIRIGTNRRPTSRDIVWSNSVPVSPNDSLLLTRGGQRLVLELAR